MGKVGNLRRLSRVAILVAIAATLVGVPLAGSANPDVSGFELDGNAAGNGATDWDALGSPLDFTGFIVDPTDDADRGYTTGGSKDTLDVSSWKWKDGDVTPDKDNIANAYAAVFTEQNNLILYFGQNRVLDRNGDANVGFWFLQDSVGLNSDGSFSGTHKDGDILVQSEFTNGGSVSGVHIFKWQGGSLTLVSNQAQCTGSKLGTADACAIVNTGTISTSWAGSITAPYFFEGGLNLSGLFPQAVPCFSTFLTNTRTSQSESAQLKDFALGGIDTCGSIEITKVAQPGDSTEFDYSTTVALNPSTFKLTNGATRAYDKLGAGQYSVTEAAQTGSWAFDSLTCPTASGPGTSVQISGQTANITLGFLGDVKCTYVNKRKPQVKVVKVTDPTTDSGKFNLQINGTTHAGDVGNGGDTGFKEVPAGQQVTVGELAGTGTSLANYVSSVSCDSDKGGANPGTSHSFTANFGDKVTCTITNRHKPEVKVVKVTNPTTDLGKFNLLINGNVEGADVMNGQDTGFKQVAAGAVTVGESAGTGTSLGNYDSKVECDSTKGSTNPGTSHGFTVNYGDKVTCTITNIRKATLTVIKHVVNDNGGSKLAAAFPISVSGASPSPASFAGAESPGTIVAIGPGAYNVTETEDPGYAATYSAGCSGSLPAGGSATCTITNNDKPATLTVIKHVVNDNGGSATASNFTMTINGVTAQGGNAFAGVESPGVTKTLTTVGAYNVSESSLAGYTQTSTSADCAGTIALGESKTCTITNDDLAAKLIVIKHVVNDNGGTAVSGDFSMTVDDAGSNPPSFPGAESPGTDVAVDPGAYSVSESGPAGYQMSQSADCSGTIALGQTKTCTVTNDDQAGQLVVIKHVVNDSGGAALASAWTMNASGPTPLSFVGVESPGTSSQVSAGAYKVTESGGPAGYALSYSGDCDADGDVTVPLGQTRTCTLTNDDQLGTLIIIKHVVNDSGGNAIASSWTMNAAGQTPLSFAGKESPGTSSTVQAGAYNVTESGGPAGYALSYSGDCDEDGDVSVALGQTRTCTLTNDDLPATLVVKKVVVNDNGGTKVASDFSFQVNGGEAQSFDADGQNDLMVNAGVYGVVEQAVAGYTTSYSNCSNLVIPLGGSATCTVTNNDVPRGQGSITVSKSANPTSIKEPGGPVTFSVTITNTSVDVDVAIENVVDDKFGDLDDSGGNGCFDVPINLAPGEKVNCTFQKSITGVGGTSHINTVTASGHDENGHALSASDDARVDITERLIDLVIVKEASSPTPLNGIVNYSLTVTNKGPDTATNVQLADPAPVGITYLTANPSQGTCNLSPALITCSLGSIAAGQTVTIAITGRATTVGSHTNTATVTGGGGRETNPADNVDSAVTVVPAPLKPPTVKPTPEPAVCLALTVSPKMIKADGKPDKVTVKVTAGSKRVKGVRVVVRGTGVKKSAKTNRKGVAVLKINPKKPGLITVTVVETNQKLCGPKRIGVVGVFLPPLTG